MGGVTFPCKTSRVNWPSQKRKKPDQMTLPHGRLLVFKNMFFQHEPPSTNVFICTYMGKYMYMIYIYIHISVCVSPIFNPHTKTSTLSRALILVIQAILKQPRIFPGVPWRCFLSLLRFAASDAPWRWLAMRILEESRGAWTRHRSLVLLTSGSGEFKRDGLSCYISLPDINLLHMEILG